MKVSTENDNNFGYEKITILVDNIPLIQVFRGNSQYEVHIFTVCALKLQNGIFNMCEYFFYLKLWNMMITQYRYRLLESFLKII